MQRWFDAPVFVSVPKKDAVQRQALVVAVTRMVPRCWMPLRVQPSASTRCRTASSGFPANA